MLIQTLLITICLALHTLSAFAEVKTFTKEYTYEASELDSKVTSRINATEQVKRLLLEELGVFLVSHTEVVNSQLTKDQITSITAGIVSAVVLDEKWDGHKYWLKAKVDADPSVVQKTIDIISADSKNKAGLEAAQKRIVTLTKELDAVKNDLGSTQKDKQIKYNNIVDRIKLSDMMQEYYRLRNNGTAENILIDYLSKMISIDNKFIDAFRERANVYKSLKKYSEYESDLISIISLASNDCDSYKELADINLTKKNYAKFIEYEYKSIICDKYLISKPTKTSKSTYDIIVKKYPNDFRIYLIRGYYSLCAIVYGQKNSKLDAISDINKSLKIKKDQPIAYYLLANLVEYQANYIGRAKDIKSVNQIINYCTIGLMYSPTPIIEISLLSMRANYGRSIMSCGQIANDLGRIIDIDPNYSPYYQKMALHKIDCEEYNQAIYYYKKAIEYETNVGGLEALYNSLAELYVNIGDNHSAVIMYNNIIDILNKRIEGYISFLNDNQSGDMLIKEFMSEKQLRIEEIKDKIRSISSE